MEPPDGLFVQLVEYYCEARYRRLRFSLQLSFRSVQQEIVVIKKKIRDLLHMPEALDESADSADSLGEVAKELETMMSDYFRRTVHKQDIHKNIEVRT